jgi:hypothetical protein
MFTITNIKDVLAVATTFGPAALDHIINNNTMSSDTSAIIRSARVWAKRQIIELESSSDTNRNYDVTAVYYVNTIGSEYITNLSDIVVTRTGIGSFTLPIAEAVAQGQVLPEQLVLVLGIIRDRNAARKTLGL